ncbi:Uncharacterized protein FWK35_00005991 [Aphis craccivora]|uniref:Uncharacterized protein n=1 Tax=Aphis craccivora TaxID=307492 RepID=A0A6G0Z5Z9_APHCR|nr:Uncharacterized protein FWK35_00005991 [Aphis craccivora]
MINIPLILQEFVIHRHNVRIKILVVYINKYHKNHVLDNLKRKRKNWSRSCIQMEILYNFTREKALKNLIGLYILSILLAETHHIIIILSITTFLLFLSKESVHKISERSTLLKVDNITSRNNASISNFGDGFRWKSQYPWCIIEVKISYGFFLFSHFYEICRKGENLQYNSLAFSLLSLKFFLPYQNTRKFGAKILIISSWNLILILYSSIKKNDIVLKIKSNIKKVFLVKSDLIGLVRGEIKHYSQNTFNKLSLET